MAQKLGPNPWLCLPLPPTPPIPSTVDPSIVATFALHPEEHALSRLFTTTLSSVLWQSPLFLSTDHTPDTLQGTSVVERLRLVMKAQNAQFLQRVWKTALGATYVQFARYIDAWNVDLHLNPSLTKFEGYGLVFWARPLLSLTSGAALDEVLIQVVASALVLDAMVAAEILFSSEPSTQRDFASRLEPQSSSRPPPGRTTIFVYQSDVPLPPDSAALICRQTVEWNAPVQHVLNHPGTLHYNHPGETSQSSSYSSTLAQNLSLLLGNSFNPKPEDTAELNVRRAAFTLLTLWGILPVRPILGYIIIYILTISLG